MELYLEQFLYIFPICILYMTKNFIKPNFKSAKMIFRRNENENTFVYTVEQFQKKERLNKNIVEFYLYDLICMNANTCNTLSPCSWFYCLNMHKATFNSGKEAEKQNNLNNTYRNLGHCGIKINFENHCHFRK